MADNAEEAEATHSQKQEENVVEEELRGARSRTLTAKGLEYKLDQCLKKLESCRRSHMKVAREFEANIDLMSSKEHVQYFIQLEEEKYIDLLTACHELIEVDPTGSQEKLIADESHMALVSKFQARIQEIYDAKPQSSQTKEVGLARSGKANTEPRANSIRSVKANSVPVPKAHSIRSVRTRSSHQTSHYSKSSKSTTSSAARTKLAATAAKLKVDKLYQEQEAAYEIERKRAEVEHKGIMLQKHIMATEAQIQALDELDDNRNFDLHNDFTNKRILDLHDNEIVNKERHMKYFLESQSQIAEIEPNLTKAEIEPNLTKAEIEPNLTSQVNEDRSSYVGFGKVEHEVSRLVEAHESPQKGSSKVPPKSLPPRVPPNLNPNAISFKPAVANMNLYQTNVKPESSKSVDVNLLKNVVEILAKKNDLPKPQPGVFKGDLMEYTTWNTSFEMYIEQQVTNPAEKIFYLNEYTGGEAKEAIQGCLRLHTDDAFIKAKSILKERFGDEFMIAQAYRNKLRDWPKVQNNDGMALQKFSDFLQNCLTIKESTGHLGFLDDPEENKKLLLKTPIYLVGKWNSSIVYDFYIEGSGYPMFEVFCKFLSKEAKKACHPISSCSAVLAMGKQQNKGETIKVKKESKTDVPKTGVKSFATNTTGVKQSSHTETKKATDKPKQIKQVKDGKPKDQKEYRDTQKTDDKQTISQSVCLLCEENHDLDKCKQFKGFSNQDKSDYIYKEGLCRSCLIKGHIAKNCPKRSVCTECNRRHPTVLHDLVEERFHQRQKESAISEQSKPDDHCVSHRIKVNRNFIGDTHSMIVPVWLHHCTDGLNRVLVYALLDDQSDACFIKESTLNTIKATGTQVHLQLATVLGEETVLCTKVQGLVVQGVYEQKPLSLPPTYSRENIPARKDQIPRKETAQIWPHLHRITDKLMPYDSNIEIGLIIGLNCTKALKPKEIIPGNEDDPFARRTNLGWGIIGKVSVERSSTDNNVIQVYRTLAQEVVIKDDKKVSFLIVPNTVKEVINPDQVKKMFEIDFNDKPTDEVSMSYEDKLFMTKMKEGKFNNEEQHYEMPLPFKNENIKFDNNRALAVYRLERLKRKIKSDRLYHQNYMKSMQDMLNQGYAEEVPSQPRTDGFTYYICHHGVYHPRKPDKLRVVFDCSASYRKQSLNSQLLQGPDFANNLTGVLCRFRQEEIAFVCDIEGMYHQVSVFKEHRDVLRFLWWKDGDIDTEPIEYRMKVHLFGATSSPSVANFTLKKTAEDNKQKFGAKAAEFVKKDFYVDDGLKSVPTVEEAIQLINNSKAMCLQGGFKLHKFLSNSKEVLEAISPEERAGSIKSLNLNKDALPIERTLGVEWCVESDSFQFRINLSSKPVTRRGILSTVSSIFDPLGLVAPFILTGKRILQDLCKDGVSWDDEVSEDIKSRWEQWKGEIHLLQHIKVQRCYKPEAFGKIKAVELHHFSDASQDGYGQCSYIRLINEEDKPHCALVMAKARVTPLRAITIPRLELAAAVVSVRIHAILEKQLDYTNVTETFWTDSKVVLGYINSDAKRFHVFVANRVQQIRDKTSTEQWKYVETEKNPADHASRGMSVNAMINSTDWWNGPAFLWQPLDTTQNKEVEGIIKDDDPEIKKVVSHRTGVQPLSFIERLKYFSEWHNAIRATAVCLRLQKKFKGIKKATVNANHQNKDKSIYVPVTASEMKEAENEILRQIQAQAFPVEKAALMNKDTENEIKGVGRNKKNVLQKTSQVYKLDPFVDEDGILRVGGRIRRVSLDKNKKHPAILPKNSHITELLICHYHQKVQHQGRGITLNEIRGSGYWILGGSTLVARHIHKCINCRKFRGSTQGQKMSDLPTDRIEPSAPFTYSAVDFFGPFYIKEKRSELKRYGVLFTCMASRAVHLETANSMTTDSFINAYRRFIGRRGPINQLRSDQGTNFVGAKNELLKCLDQEKIRQELLKHNCDWIEFKMNVPHASHMGGVWERQIRTVRNVLSVLLTQHGSQLDDESLRTFMIEAEAIVNGRPLTVNTLTNSEIIEPLTPNMLLTMKSRVVLPPPSSFEKEDLYARKRWRRVQYLTNEFWSKWKREFLQSLQVRSKWNNPQRNLKVDDIVVVKDDTLARNRWKLGRVENVYNDDDGYVRKVRVRMSDSNLDSKGKRIDDITFIERPIHTLILLLEAE